MNDADRRKEIMRALRDCAIEREVMKSALGEAESEIRRHHELIVKLRQGLGWALAMLGETNDFWGFDSEYIAEFEAWQTFLNREVG